ncbi:MAG: hemolysin family protein [Actinobacteria bacterium]|nr:hemolysin family protein [Actinomycetota bacterium]
MNNVDLGEIVAMVLLLTIAGFFAAAEVAITRMNRARALAFEDEERKGAPALIKIVEDPARHLNVVLLVVLLCHISSTTMATDIAIRHTWPFGEVIATVLMTTVIFVFAEVSPKTFAVQHTDRVALRLAPTISFIARMPLLYPLARGLIALANAILPGRGLKKGPFVTEEEIRTMAEVAAGEASIEEEEKEMIHSIFEFGDTVVREVMVPRPEMVGVYVNEAPDEVLEKMLEFGYSRMPVYAERDSDNIAGLVYAKDVMRKLHGKRRNGKAREKPKLKDVIRKAMVVPESKKVSELLREMQARKTHMAIVVDEYGDVAGLVTLEDLLEEIVGEIADEYDREEPQVQPVDDSTLRVSGRLNVDELSELLDVELPNTEWDTVGGLMSGLLGKLPARGEEVEYQGLRFVAERVQGRRISKVLVTRTAAPTED